MTTNLIIYIIEISIGSATYLTKFCFDATRGFSRDALLRCSRLRLELWRRGEGATRS